MSEQKILKGILLVGGPCDGEKHTVMRDQTILYMREKPEINLLTPPSDPKSTFEIRTCRYEQGSDRQIFEFKGWV